METFNELLRFMTSDVFLTIDYFGIAWKLPIVAYIIFLIIFLRIFGTKVKSKH